MSRFEGVSSRHRVLPAVAVAVFILVFVLTERIVSAAMYFGTTIAQGSIQDGANLLSAFLSLQVLAIPVPFVIGVFAWLWLVAPVTAELRLSAVIGRSLLAAVSGVIVAVVVNIVLGMQGWFGNAQFFANSSNQAVESLFADGSNVIPFVLQDVILTALDVLPLVVLAVVLTWSWLIRHPGRQSADAVAAAV